MLTLDHLAVVAEDLATGTAWVEAALGVTMQPGGRHVRYGTHNTLLGLGDDLYLEVIAKDPGAAPYDGPTWFGLDDFTGAPRLGNWICQTDDLDALLRDAPPAVGLPRDLSRGDLTWRITVPDDGSKPYDGAYPTLIQWATGTHHPARRLADSGCRLVELTVSHPQADDLRAMLPLADDRVVFGAGPAGFSAVFDTPQGRRSLGQLFSAVQMQRKVATCAQVGFKIGHRFDQRTLMSIWTRIGEALAALANGEGLLAVFDRLRTPPDRSVAFTIAVIALGAKMAKADGLVTRTEVRAFREVFVIAPEEEDNAARVFDLARQDVAGYDLYARRIKAMFGDHEGPLCDLLEGLFHIALADGSYHATEDAFLQEVAAIFGFDERRFQRIRAQFVPDAQRDPYAVLGVDPDAPMERVRAAWGRLVRETHPDQMIARGVPPEAVKLAERRMVAINRAWEDIRAQRA